MWHCLVFARYLTSCCCLGSPRPCDVAGSPHLCDVAGSPHFGGLAYGHVARSGFYSGEWTVGQRALFLCVGASGPRWVPDPLYFGGILDMLWNAFCIQDLGLWSFQ